MNIGTIGFGNMGKTHAFAASNLKYYYNDIDIAPVLYGVAAKSFENAAGYAEIYGFVKAYKSAEELINSPNVDVVDICTPNIFHFEEITAALEAGKHIYCEKPLAISRKQYEEILSRTRPDLTCGVVFNTRFLLPVVRAKELISEGAVGEILSFDISFLHSSAMDISKTGWKQDKDICGGGVLYDLGSHAADLALYLCGKITSVFGKSQIAFPTRRSASGKEGWKTNADEAFYMTACLENGAVGHITVSKIHSGTNDDFSFEIYGTKGSLRFSLMEPNWLYFYNSSASENVRGETRIECVGRYPAPASGFPGAKAPVGWIRGHVASMHNFLRCAADGKPVSPSFEDGARVHCVLEAAYMSDESGKAENVSYIEL